jgi:hypothetical protein
VETKALLDEYEAKLEACYAQQAEDLASTEKAERAALAKARARRPRYFDRHWLAVASGGAPG